MRSNQCRLHVGIGLFESSQGHEEGGPGEALLLSCCPGSPPPPEYVEWALGVWRDDDCAMTVSDFYERSTLAQDCPPEEVVVFVPEPGSMVVLGSGLAGLAGYTALGLHSGQASRWRTRE